MKGNLGMTSLLSLIAMANTGDIPRIALTKVNQRVSLASPRTNQRRERKNRRRRWAAGDRHAFI